MLNEIFINSRRTEHAQFAACKHSTAWGFKIVEFRVPGTRRFSAKRVALLGLGLRLELGLWSVLVYRVWVLELRYRVKTGNSKLHSTKFETHAAFDLAILGVSNS